MIYEYRGPIRSLIQNCTHIILFLLTYGSECWSLNRINEEQLQVFERRILRKIVGPICDNVKFVIIVNYMYTAPDIIKTIKISKLRRTGHIMRTRGK